MALALDYRIEPLPVEPSGLTISQTRYPVAQAGKPLHLVWGGRYLWFTDSANRIGRRFQESGEIKLFARKQGAFPTRLAEWFKAGEQRLLYIDPEGGFVGVLTGDGRMSEHAFPGARPQAVSQEADEVLIGCAAAPFLLRARGDTITAVPHQGQRAVDAVGRGPERYAWYFSGDTLKGIDIERGMGPTWKLPFAPDIRDLQYGTARQHAFYCDEHRDVIGEIVELDKIIEYQLPKGTAPRRVIQGPRGTYWFTGKGGRSLFYVDAGVAVELPSARADADLYDLAVGADDTLWFTEPNAGCLSSAWVKGL